jgi:DNA ligase (NAD+)
MNRIEKLVSELDALNEAYRAGAPLVSDAEYDRRVEELRAVDPENPFLHRVEPEVFAEKHKVRHPVPMLSTEKAYSREALARFVVRVEKAAAEIGVDPVLFKVTVKLDGLAGRDDGDIFVSRGNGEEGYEISSAFEKGVRPQGGRGLGLGEIVMRQSYFAAHMQGVFEHPRNLVVGIVTSDQLNEHAAQALHDGAVHFVPYGQLPAWEGSGAELLEHLDTIRADLLADTDYPLDGLVAEVTDARLKDYMGATSHHYRWQIAIKTKGDTAVTTVERLSWQVGRTGNVTPVMAVAPTTLSGATIRRVTAHNAGLVRKQQIGPGAEIEIIRSGEVIPKLEKVLKPADAVELPQTCPSCHTQLAWQNDFLKCPNSSLCRCQVIQRIVYWFRTLGNADWFGLKTVEKMVDGGYDSLERIYAMTADEFARLGFGPVQSVNLAEALVTSRTKTVEDWRLLAAFGIPDLGKGDSRKLLGFFRLEELPALTVDDVAAIHGFGDITSRSITAGLHAIRATFRHILSLNFNLIRTPLVSEQAQVDSPLKDKGIVFTGKMQQGSREEMQARARELGAKVQTAVSGKTDYLVCGENVGATKLARAAKVGARVIFEADYLQLIETGSI